MLDSLIEELLIHSDLLDTLSTSSDMPIESRLVTYSNKLDLLDTQLEELIWENSSKLDNKHNCYD